MNMVFLVGYLGSDPYKIEGGNPKHVGASFKLATNERVKLKGEFISRTDWHKVTLWGKRAEYCIDTFKKGARVLVKGKLRNSDYTDKQGTKHYSYEIFAEQINLISQSSKDKDITVEGESVLET